MLVDATQVATALMGDAIASNLFMLGYAWQQGLVPISYDAIMRAVELNGAGPEATFSVLTLSATPVLGKDFSYACDGAPEVVGEAQAAVV